MTTQEKADKVLELARAGNKQAQELVDDCRVGPFGHGTPSLNGIGKANLIFRCAGIKINVEAENYEDMFEEV